ncbi:HNH endonuclease [Roseibacillus persicicus]|uniref:HNH endonuclease n=1 Tax=Roseibacillus persicicus TaxID=454148 RepID=A0A918WKP2_9BACT|nr:hypothetical protein [Roseibacillus persicicus]GHC54371.1 HNH endonuclease [Roseibacillus persicicus]
MRSLPKPTHDAGTTYELCISKVRNVALKRKLSALKDSVERASDEYDAEATLGKLHLISASEDIEGVSKKEILKVYTNRMAKSGAPGRSVYDKILISSPQRRCPLCGQRDASTLDHYLPESRHSSLVVTPLNLVPSCKDCNFNKRAVYPNSRETETFHPYYDDFDDGFWLRAEMVQSDPVGVLFDVQRPHDWDAAKFERANYHFKTLALSQLYSDHAAGELVGQKPLFKELFEVGGSDAVRQDLEGRARSLRITRPNSWQAVLYDTAATDSWFCAGGFENIPD